MLNRLKRAWKLSGKQPDIIEALTMDQINALPELGDGKAEFLGDGSHEEFIEQERADAGTDAWYKRIDRLGKTENDD